MMFLPMPNGFQIGGVADCKINGQPRRVRHDGNALTILDAEGAEDRRDIVEVHPWSDGATMFICGLAAKMPSIGQ